MIVAAYCLNCLHLRDQRVDLESDVVITDSDVETCDAFPDGIPELILGGTENHSRPYPGDRGIRFEPVNPAHEHP
jgi:hypothetical protein